MVTFPRPLPDVQFTNANFELERFISSAKSGGQLTNVVEYADPAWKFTATTRTLRYSDGQMVNVWLDSLCGGLKPALIRSPHYCCPRAHIHNRGAEKRNGVLTAITNQNVLTVTTVQAALVLSAGDFVSLQDGQFYALARVVEAVADGTTRTIEIVPKLPGYIKIGAEVKFDRAELLMRMDVANVSKWTRDSTSVSFTFMESRL